MRHRDRLPQLDGSVFLTDGGLETVLVFDEGLELPAFASFPLVGDDAGTQLLRRYYETYGALARECGLGFVLESPTWRASARWGTALGYDADGLDAINRKAIALLDDIRTGWGEGGAPVVISGCIGPQDDGYNPTTILSDAGAQEYHGVQIATLADTAADMISAITMTYADEAIGIARAARDAGLPVAISFTVETDGRLPSGQSLGDAIEQVDNATASAPAYFMVNCAHPTHFDDTLAAGGPWLERIRGLRANASSKSHAELDEATKLDAGDPADLAARYADLKDRMPQLSIFGGCCGTDHRHVRAVRDACLAVD